MVTDRQIKSVANKATSLREMLSKLGLTYAGSNYRKIKDCIGSAVYDEIKSGVRTTTPRYRWMKVPVNRRH